MLAQQGVTSAIIGASQPEQLDPSLAALDFDIDEELAGICDAIWYNTPRRPIVEGYR